MRQLALPTLWKALVGNGRPAALRGGLLPLLALALVACGADTPTELTPTLKITSPAQNGSVNLPGGSGPQGVPVDFVTNWLLKAPGQCGSEEHCGHIDVLVDSTSCNAPGKPFNAQAIVSPAQADLGLCQMAKGLHTISLELHDDAGGLVRNPLGDPVTAEVKVIAQ